jgi:NAD+ kinase
MASDVQSGDSDEVCDVIEFSVRESTTHSITLLFDPEHNLEERILNEQFVS